MSTKSCGFCGAKCSIFYNIHDFSRISWNESFHYTVHYANFWVLGIRKFCMKPGHAIFNMRLKLGDKDVVNFMHRMKVLFN